MDKIINNTRGINLLINEEFLELLNIDSNLGFELKSYDEYMPIYTIVLNFMFETGGVF